jgi:hypothetical protein
MNEDDLKKVKSKKVKVKKDTEVVEAKADKKTRKKVEAKNEVEPKLKKTRDKAKIDDVIVAEDSVKTKARKAKIDDLPAETVPKVKKTTAKKTVEVKAEEKPKKSKAKKAVAEILPGMLPLVAKIQTQENFDLSEKETETEELSPVFKALAEPKLPDLREENRAFLQMQSPTRIFFYWSLKTDSYNTLRRALGNRADDYFLAIRLVNLNTNRDEIHQVGNRGSWWFNQVESDAKYRAEVGFYAPNRPFVRIVFSNTLETPRLKPSENAAFQPYFAVTANQFAEVLDLAGYSQDAFEVYLAGDEPNFADDATQKAFVQLTGKGQVDFSEINLNELRYVLFALASGVSLYSLREQVSGNLFEFLSTLTDQNPAALTEEKVILALEEFFGYSPFDEEITEEFGAPTVFGASLINFPGQLRKKKSRFNPQPISSFSLK